MGCANGREMIPDTQRLEHADGRVGKGRDPPVEFRVQSRSDGHGIGNDGLEATTGQGESERQPDHPAAADEDIRFACHGRHPSASQTPAQCAAAP